MVFMETCHQYRYIMAIKVQAYNYPLSYNKYSNIFIDVYQINVVKHNLRLNIFSYFYNILRICATTRKGCYFYYTFVLG